MSTQLHNCLATGIVYMMSIYSIRKKQLLEKYTKETKKKKKRNMKNDETQEKKFNDIYEVIRMKFY